MKKLEFSELHASVNPKEVKDRLLSINDTNILSTLNKASAKLKLDFNDYLNLISPKGIFYLEEFAQLAKQITWERFGKTIQLFMPMYLSNHCRSSCLYCGFSFENKIKRKTLSQEEIHLEAKALKEKGIKHLLILTGEDYSNTSIEYIKNAIIILKEYFPSISIEIYPLNTNEYEELITSGADSLILYQETYDTEVYKKYHIRGVKKNMEYRLNGPDRGAKASFRKIGLGALLGLADPFTELYFLGLHADHLLKNYWKTNIQFSLPRMRPNASNFHEIISVSDKLFLQFIFALRIYFQDSPIVLSTRESIKLRDNLIGLGVTTYSAESRTDPGGYSIGDELEQFEIEDNRSLQEIIELIHSKGYDPVLKDFDKSLI
jgi:2-iminoacetate synthase